MSKICTKLLLLMHFFLMGLILLEISQFFVSYLLSYKIMALDACQLKTDKTFKQQNYLKWDFINIVMYFLFIWSPYKV